jgi:hypothetical protein
MTQCKHRWEEVSDKPIYQCARCGAFLRSKSMNTEDDEFNRIEREASLRTAAVKATIIKREWIGLSLAEIDAIIDGNMTITDSKLHDAVYAVVLDTMTTLMEKNNG